MPSSIRSLAGCMRALIMVLTSSVPSPTYALSEIFPFQACAEVGGPTQTALLNRKMRARLWDELRPGPSSRGLKPIAALGWSEPCAGVAHGFNGRRESRPTRMPNATCTVGKRERISLESSFSERKPPPENRIRRLALQHVTHTVCSAE